MSEPYVPQGELETHGWGKETTFGTFAASTVWHAFRTFQAKMLTNPVQKAPRASLADPYPATGGRSGSASLDVETTADTFGYALAYALGKQTITASSTQYAGVTATSVLNPGATTATLGLNSLFPVPLLFPGVQIDIDTASNKETVTLVTVGGTSPGTGNTIVTFTPALTKTHSVGTTVVGTNAKPVNVITLGSPLPTFSIQQNRPGSVCTDYLGCKIDSLALAWAAKQGLTAKASLVFRDFLVDGSPAAATLSAKNPYVFEQGFVPGTFCGEVTSAGGGSSLLSVNLTVNNNLLKDYHVAGGGNLVRAFPEQKRTISGTITLGFESQAELTAFQAAAAGGALPPVSMIVPIQGIDTIGATTTPWSVTLYLPKVFLQDFSVNDDTSKVLQQTLSIICAESTPGASDQVTAYLVQSASTAY